MKKWSILSMLLVALLMTNCGKATSELVQEKELYDQAMQIHDEIMKISLKDKAEAIGTYQSFCDSLRQTEASIQQEDLKACDQISEIKTTLMTTHEHMQQWMKTYSEKSYNVEMPHEEAITFLTEMNSSVSNLNQEYQTVIKKYDTLLATLKNLKNQDKTDKNP